MTTRKPLPSLLAAASLALVAGCATPGPLHTYTLPAPDAPAIHDTGGDSRTEVPSFVGENDTVIGFAYDPFTDHFFLRLAPGDRIRVVDRPARAIKREYLVPELAGGTAADLAIRPRDGHVFAPHPHEPALIEFTRLGKVVRTITLSGTTAPPAGIALDVARNELLTLCTGDGASTLHRHRLDGSLVAEQRLPAAAAGPIAYDSEREELYAPLAGRGAFGVFDRDGQLLRALADPAAHIDIGPRSFIRVF